ncbi:MAG: hypothetical protein ACPGJV_07705 [Bacteriovoracaceae bacterium]
MSDSYQMVLDRLSMILQTRDPESEMSVLAELQQEMQPHLSMQAAYDLVIIGIIKTYEDYDLDFWWSKYVEEREGIDKKSGAA